MTSGKKINKFSHLNNQGDVEMVDVSTKLITERTAVAVGKIKLLPATIKTLRQGQIPKGNVLTAAKLAGIQAAKKTSELIPLCHSLNLTWVNIEFLLENDAISIISTVKTREATGVEMEALTAVSTAALTIYDMCKALDKTMRILNIELKEKTGGKSSHIDSFRPRVGVITMSDSIAAGSGLDISGQIIKEGFLEAGCITDEYALLQDGSSKLNNIIQKWIKTGVELIITTGGTGLGPRDLTIDKVTPILDGRLPGVEQALHSFGRKKLKTAMLSRLLAGRIGNAIIICLPGSPGAVQDALIVLIPAIFHAFHMLKGEKH